MKYICVYQAHRCLNCPQLFLDDICCLKIISKRRLENNKTAKGQLHESVPGSNPHVKYLCQFCFGTVTAEVRKKKKKKTSQNCSAPLRCRNISEHSQFSSTEKRVEYNREVIEYYAFLLYPSDFRSRQSASTPQESHTLK